MQQLLDPTITLTTEYRPTYQEVFSVDPRPDLVSGEIWTRLLRKAARASEMKSWKHLQALSCLWNVRLVGTALRWDSNHGYRLEPFIIDNWESMDWWKECRINHFKQYAAIWTEWFHLASHHEDSVIQPQLTIEPTYDSLLNEVLGDLDRKGFRVENLDLNVSPVSELASHSTIVTEFGKLSIIVNPHVYEGLSYIYGKPESRCYVVVSRPKEIEKKGSAT